jgi:hypothetical protein
VWVARRVIRPRSKKGLVTQEGIRNNAMRWRNGSGSKCGIPGRVLAVEVCRGTQPMLSSQRRAACGREPMTAGILHWAVVWLGYYEIQLESASITNRSMT